LQERSIIRRSKKKSGRGGRVPWFNKKKEAVVYQRGQEEGRHQPVQKHPSPVVIKPQQGGKTLTGCEWEKETDGYLEVSERRTARLERKDPAVGSGTHRWNPENRN